jgi:hypothetical protein
MNHPEVSLMNAQLYLSRKMQEADTYRQSKKVLENNRTFWGALAYKFQFLKNSQKQNSLDESTLLERVN